MRPAYSKFFSAPYCQSPDNHTLTEEIMDLCFIVTSCKSSRIYRNKGHQAGKPYDKDDSDYLAFEETTWL